MHTDLGTHVRARRRQLGLTQDQLAERVGDTYDQADISHLERGGVELPRLRTLVKLAAALEVLVGDLLIAADWFTERHVAPRFTVVEQDPLVTVLDTIEVQLGGILELEHEAQSRSDRLRTMIHGLQ